MKNIKGNKEQDNSSLEKQHKKNKKVRMSIKKKLVSSITLTSIISLILLAVFLYQMSSTILKNKTMDTSYQFVNQVNYNIETFLDGMENNLKIVSENSNITNLDVNNKVSVDHLKNFLKTVKDSNSDIIYTYFADMNGVMIQSDGQVRKPSSTYDARTREWYKESLRNPDKIYWTDCYEDAQKKILVISLSKAVKRGDKIIGVASIDIGLNELVTGLSQIKLGEKGYLVVTSKEGMTLVHPDKSLIGKKTLTEESFWKDLSSKESGNFEYKYSGKAKFAGFTTNKITVWKLMVTLGEDEIAKDLSSIKYFSIIAVIVGGLLSLVLAYYIGKVLSVAVNRLKDIIEKFGSGDLTVAVPQDLKEKANEIGDIASSLDLSIGNIRNMMISFKEHASSISGESENLSSVSEEMASSAENVSVAIQDVAKGSQGQSEDLVEITEITQDFSNKIDSVVTNMAEVMENAQNIDNMAAEGSNGMKELVQSTQTVKGSFNDFSKEIVDLGSGINEVNEIIGLINSIAEQTNLLALNAAIESARAGEAGRGFAVVADEIRKLSEQTKNSSESITSIIKSISNKTGKIIDDTKVIVKEMDSEVETINNSMEQFTSIVIGVQEILPRIDSANYIVSELNESKSEIVNKIENASSVSQEVSASSEEIAASSEEMCASTEEVASTAEKLNKMTNDMEEQINKFKF
ncbi:methyl-accepting chemotaxis protein [Hathewaya massiliensis]|uniref:methyl-accepting chemotaxis protein n=1 Tax=Hathewaya massiliensis TaxID=1964382 RepID=UPI001158B673|nr:methyl-accepting chemotaxis protein [Hathewaya massiliensis]